MVYASPQHHERDEVWNELIELSNSIVGPWCVAGNFNQVLYDHEKKVGHLLIVRAVLLSLIIST